jgi:acetyl esterase
MGSYKLEKPALELTQALSKAPPLAQVPLDDVRKAVEAAQAAPIPMPAIDESWTTVPSGFGDVRVRLVRPQGVRGSLPVLQRPGTEFRPSARLPTRRSRSALP